MFYNKYLAQYLQLTHFDYRSMATFSEGVRGANLSVYSYFCLRATALPNPSV